MQAAFPLPKSSLHIYVPKMKSRKIEMMKRPFLPLLVLFLLAGCQRDAAVSQPTALSDAVSSPAVPCGKLSKPADIDDLLQQIRAELGSTCLFDLSAQQLETAWGIKVFDFRGLNRKQIEELNIQANAFRKTENAFYILRLPPNPDHNTAGYPYTYTDEIRIEAGDKLMAEKGFGIGRDNTRQHFPTSFPPPDYIGSPEEIDPAFSKKPPMPSDFHLFAAHVWSNPDKKPELPHLMIFAAPNGIPNKIVVYRQALSKSYPFYCDNLERCGGRYRQWYEQYQSDKAAQ